MRYYPIFIDMQERDVLVVGGGLVALQKIRSLIRSGANVKVVTKELIAQEILDFDLPVEIREYEENDIIGRSIVVAATNNTEVNAQIYRDAKKHNALLNAVDDKENCDFYLGALSQCGDITVSVSTAGKSPIVAKKVRDKVSAIFNEKYNALLELYAETRLDAYRELTPQGRKLFFNFLELKFDEILDDNQLARDYYKEIKASHKKTR